MTDIYLTDEQYKKLPYKGTVVPRSRTYGEIIGLLEAHNITDYQYLKVQGQEMFSFPITVKRHDVEQGFLIKMEVPKLYYEMTIGRGYHAKKTMKYLENESWRIFWWYLKSKLEAIEFGISDEFKEFLYNITYSLPDHQGQRRDILLGEELSNNLEQLPKLIASPQHLKELDDHSREQAEVSE